MNGPCWRVNRGFTFLEILSPQAGSIDSGLRFVMILLLPLVRVELSLSKVSRLHERLWQHWNLLLKQAPVGIPRISVHSDSLKQWPSSPYLLRHPKAPPKCWAVLLAIFAVKPNFPADKKMKIKTKIKRMIFDILASSSRIYNFPASRKSLKEIVTAEHCWALAPHQQASADFCRDCHLSSAPNSH